MYHIGIHYYGHDTSVALLKNNQLIFAVEEEKLSRIKHDRALPLKSLSYIVKKYKINNSNLATVNFATIPERLLKEKYLKLFADNPNDYYEVFFNNTNIEKMKSLTKIRALLKKKIFPNKEHNFFHHHLCHQYSSYLLSGFDRATCVSLDGLGEIESGCIGYANKNSIKILENVKFPHSLGECYTAITEYLGYQVDSGEGTVMALAALGKSCLKVKKINKSYKKIFQEIIEIKNNGEYRINLNWFNYWNTRGKLRVSEKFIKIFGAPSNKKKNKKNYYNIAAALQERFEEAYIAYIKRAIRLTGSRNIVLSGGCALNCKSNGRIVKELNIKNLYIQPAAGDAGTSVGAGYLGYLKYSKAKKFVPKYYDHSYFGPYYNDKEILQSLKRYSSIKFKKIRNIENYVAELLHKQKVIGWYQGRVEFGPRALGNRSIIASPEKISIKNRINSKIKKREFFRPFAPSVIEGYEKKIFNLKCNSPFMLIATDINKKFLNKINAVKHLDNSARIQVVLKKTNPKYFKLITELHKLNGLPLILNTSFNGKGEPIVCTPNDAIESFLKNGLDFLVMNNFFVFKNGK